MPVPATTFTGVHPPSTGPCSGSAAQVDPSGRDVGGQPREVVDVDPREGLVGRPPGARSRRRGSGRDGRCSRSRTPRSRGWPAGAAAPASGRRPRPARRRCRAWWWRRRRSRRRPGRSPRRRRRRRASGRRRRRSTRGPARSTPASRAARAITGVPSTATCRCASSSPPSGWTVVTSAVAPSVTWAASSGSAKSPTCSVRSGRSGAVPSRRTTARTWAPRSTSAAHTREPTRPLAPVTTTTGGVFSAGVAGVREGVGSVMSSPSPVQRSGTPARGQPGQRRGRAGRPAQRARPLRGSQRSGSSRR